MLGQILKKLKIVEYFKAFDVFCLNLIGILAIILRCINKISINVALKFGEKIRLTIFCNKIFLLSEILNTRNIETLSGFILNKKVID